MRGVVLLGLLGALGGCGGMDGGDQKQAVTVTEVPLAYVMRSLPRDEDGALAVTSLEAPADFQAGARLMVRGSVSSRSEAQDISTPLLGAGHDIRDLSVSYDGQRLLFAARAPAIEDADDDEQPTWNLWEYDFRGQAARRLISSDLLAEEGQDRYPAYLPDGRIVFASTRQRQAGARLLDEGKPRFMPLEEGRDTHAFALHVMNADGDDIEQITFNMSHDVAPLVGRDGRVIFQRWDNKDSVDRFDLYRVNPDGTALEPLYGANSHDERNDEERQFLPLSLMGDGRLLTAVRLREARGGEMEPRAIDIDHYVNRDGPLYGSVAGQPEQALPAPGGAWSERVALQGRLSDLVSLEDGTGRFLMAWSPCRLLDGASLRPCTPEYLQQGLPEAPPAFGLWVFDPAEGTQRPVVKPQDNLWVTELVAATPRTLPPLVVAAGRDEDLAEDNLARLDIRSVYDLDGGFNSFHDPALPGVSTLEAFRDPSVITPGDRRVRFLRITKGVLIPDDDVRLIVGAHIGRAPNFGMREIVGYVPVEPDGSVRVQVPANAPLGLQLVDAQGKAVYSRHGAWLNLRPGETLQCQGCHERGSSLPHGRDDGLAPSVNPGAPLDGLPFPNTRTDVVAFANAGETMAQALTRLHPEREIPAMDMLAFDAWSDPATADEILPRYADLQTPAPATPDCQQQWQPECRTVIHYEDHIQPIWDRPRQAMVGGALTDVTCSSCHNRRDASNALQVPPAQLELTGDASPDLVLQPISYRELLFDDDEVVLVNGALVDRLVVATDDDGNVVYQTDEDGELILDSQGNPIPELETVELDPPIRFGRARTSTAFFDIFAAGGSHEGWLDAQEHRLLAEWIDLGAQLYNDPFRVPEN
ncbi:hypothetical protein [Alcanivorax jadensis]|uniref:HzsA-related protein n=1 Tax=Alcanivorax jadensis TaxID=64988 RepID=UPI0026E95A71|nr:hypothetical protein [Alcanivorax jadensis]